MVEACGATASARTGSVPAAEAMRWQISGKTFELRSPSAAILEIGRLVLALGRGATAALPPAGERVWQVDTHPTDADAWQVRGPAADHAQAFATPAAAIRAVEFATVQHLLAAVPATISLHAALLGRGRTGLLIVGPSESGKSTLATALWRQGFAFCGDDVALVAADSAFLSAFPRRVSLRHGSRALLGEALWHPLAATPSFMATSEGCLFHPHELPGSSLPAAELAPAGIVFLGRRGVSLGPAELRSIPPAHALLALAPYSNIIRNAGMGSALECLQPLLARTSAHDLGRGPLPAMLAAVARLLPGNDDAP
jgi:hypothetical protein